MTTQIARAANKPVDYKRFGNDPRTIEPWEDGMRTKINEKNFEW